MAALFAFGCQKNRRLFHERELKEAGIDFANTLSPSEDFNIIDYLYFYNGGGVAAGDINNDGLPDLYFSGNQVSNRLYLNKGNLQFEDITESAGVGGKSTWNTGSVMADINGDGLLDIYVCAVVGVKHLTGHNELYINNGDLTFTEMSAEYGLDFESYSSSVAFLDYDLDGDLDMYLVNHALHTPKSFGHSSARTIRSYESGDKLLRNDNGKFTDVSEEAGIFGGIIGYGLGVAVSDFNNDGYPDLYVGNDFHEDDYFYLNNRDGTFTECGRKAFTVTSRFSMGNDVVDINHDGLPDLLTLDMLADDETVLKRSEGEENINIQKMRTDEYGYSYQYQRNMLHINQGDGTFMETALLSGVAATDWSWGALFADFDHDGHQDLFVSNGIPRRPNDLDYIKYVSNEQVVNTITATKLVDEQALALMPSGSVQNYVFKGNGDLSFQNMSHDWLPDLNTCSTASAVADLDNDGDLDIIINNVDAPPMILINETNASSNYLKIRLKYKGANEFGIGARVYCYYDQGTLQMKEMYTARGYQASSEPVVHFGLGKSGKADSLVIVWPDKKHQVLYGPEINQELVVTYTDDGGITRPSTIRKRNLLFQPTGDSLLDFIHREDLYTDFDRLKLLPYQQSDRGPATAVGDLNGDGLDDIYFGGSKRIPAQLFIQSQKKLMREKSAVLLRDSIDEVVDAVIADFNNDGKADIFVGTGGADFYAKAEPLMDKVYISSADTFLVESVADYYENASCVRLFDFDSDGDPDLFVGNESVSNDFGKIPRSYLLRNDGGKFTPVQQSVFDKLGMVTDAVWDDFDGDGDSDLVVVGEWMEPVFLRNERGVFEPVDMLDSPLNGLWQSVSVFDVNRDGKNDYILGNWGLNTKFAASPESPMTMYYGDVDNNGKSETIIAIAKKGKYYPIDGLDVLGSQLPGLRKKFPSYHLFAGKTINEVFSQQELDKTMKFHVHELASGYLENRNGKFVFVAFPPWVQTAPVMTQLKYDFDNDGEEDVLLAGNYFGVQPFYGRYGSFGGALLRSDGQLIEGRHAGLNLINQSARGLNIIRINGIPHLVVTINNGAAQTYRLTKQ